MPKKYPPLTPGEVIKILEKRGFILRTQVGSHAQYEKPINQKKWKVTVDKSVSAYSKFLMKSMISQSGLTRDQFYCTTKKTAAKINKKIDKDFLD